MDEADDICRPIWELDKEWEVDESDEVVSPDDDNNEGWVNEMDELTSDEQDNIMDGIQLIWLILMKASFDLCWAAWVVIYSKQQNHSHVWKFGIVHLIEAKMKFIKSYKYSDMCSNISAI